MCFFFFKQKTAYEMRISDWSSDVCSSDLHRPRAGNPLSRADRCAREHARLGLHRRAFRYAGPEWRNLKLQLRYGALHLAPCPGAARRDCRSEEHTSELRSLMRISYAVFCLQKKKSTNHILRIARTY